MNWRVRFLALAILFLFGAFGIFYYKSFVKKRVHGVILIVANGLDLTTINRARQQSDAARSEAKVDIWMRPAGQKVPTRHHVLNIEGLPKVAILNVQGLGQPVADEAAASTALACGQRVKNGLVGCNSLDQMLDTLIYAAQNAHRATGLVTTSSLVDPTPVAFYTYMRDPREKYRAASALVDSSRIDVIMGGGADYFTPADATNEYGRQDGRDLTRDMDKKGYNVVRTLDELRKVPTWPVLPTLRQRQIFGLFASQSFYFSGASRRDVQQPYLRDMVRTAIQCLQYNPNGYFLVVEHGLIAAAARQNMTDLAVNETIALDQTIETAIRYAGPNTLIIVTNNYSLGAIADAVPPPPPPTPVAATQTLRKSWTKRSAEKKAEDIPMPQWLSGPGGPQISGEQQTWFRQRINSGAFSTNSASIFSPDLAARFATEATPTASPAWMASQGFGSDRLTGFISNTDLYYILQELF
jgi:alkaline phosphatase